MSVTSNFKIWSEFNSKTWSPKFYKRNKFNFHQTWKILWLNDMLHSYSWTGEPCLYKVKSRSHQFNCKLILENFDWIMKLILINEKSKVKPIQKTKSQSTFACTYPRSTY